MHSFRETMDTVHEVEEIEEEEKEEKKSTKALIAEAENALMAICKGLESSLQRLKMLQKNMQEQETVEKALVAALLVAGTAGRRFGAVLLHELEKIDTPLTE